MTETHLERLAPLISGHIGVETRLRLIPNGVTEAEQLSVLQIMADATEGCTEVTLEVSHGFRHLPMIAVVAAVYLQALRDVQVRDIWYGFYDPDTDVGTVHDLKGLPRLFDRVRALSQFEHGGDYGVFATLLAAEGRTEFEAPSRFTRGSRTGEEGVRGPREREEGGNGLLLRCLSGLPGTPRYSQRPGARLPAIRPEGREGGEERRGAPKLISRFLDEFPDN